jgi:hypothetical protein
LLHLDLLWVAASAVEGEAHSEEQPAFAEEVRAQAAEVLEKYLCFLLGLCHGHP